jgi:pimeloyl-ACP methyl ester carboxylesterase
VTVYFEASDARLFFQDEGAGTTMVLLHAFPLSGEMWRPQIEALRSRSRLIVPDLRGFGRSDSPDDPAPSLDRMASDVIALLDELEIERFVLCGLSMGGYLSFALLRRLEKDRALGLVLCDTRAKADSEEGRRNRLAMAELAEREGSGPVAEAMTKLIGETTRRTDPDLWERVRALIRSNGGKGIAAAQRAMAARPDSTPLLSELTMPGLVLVGEEDVLTPPDEARRMADALPDSRFHLVPKAGHLSNLEAPDEFNARLAAFLNEIEESF